MPIAEEKRFSPLFGVPLERRLQTLIILLWWIEPSFASALFLYLCTWKLFLPFAIAYGVWIYFDKAPERGGRRVEFMRNLTIWRWFADYFPARIVKVNTPQQKKKKKTKLSQKKKQI
jgi:2-acylglycerol O-acyltransferase 2